MKKVFFWIALVVPLIVLAEIGSWLLLKSIPTRVRERALFKTPLDYIDSARKAVSSKPQIGIADERHQTKGQKVANEKIFDSDLGWSYPPNLIFRDLNGVSYHYGPTGERLTCTSFPSDLIASYGDSFTNCAEVPDHETWQTFLGSVVKRNVLNYGVNGFGTDQAYLLYSRHTNLQAPIVMLCIFPENINRVVNVYRTFYIYNDPLCLTKPRFGFSEGTTVLRTNPVKSVDGIQKLSDPAFVAEIGSHDYWYQLAGKLPGLGFPYIYSVVQWRDVLARSIKASLCRHFKGIVPPTFNQDLYQETEPLGVMCHIVDEFVSLAHKRDQYPIVVIIPHTDYVREVLELVASRTDPLIEYMKSRNYFFMDLVRAMADMNPTIQQLDSWYQGHATPEGNLVTARLMSKSLDKRAELDPALHKILVAK